MMYCMYIIIFCTLSHTNTCVGTPTQEGKMSDSVVEQWWGRLIDDRTIRSDDYMVLTCPSRYLCGTTHVIVIILILYDILFVQLLHDCTH